MFYLLDGNHIVERGSSITGLMRQVFMVEVEWEDEATNTRMILIKPKASYYRGEYRQGIVCVRRRCRG